MISPLLYISATVDDGRFFPGGANGRFPKDSQRFFQAGAKNGEILFFPLETKKTTFFTKNVIGKCDFKIPRQPPLPTPMCATDYIVSGLQVATRHGQDLDVHCKVFGTVDVATLTNFIQRLIPVSGNYQHFGSCLFQLLNTENTLLSHRRLAKPTVHGLSKSNCSNNLQTACLCKMCNLSCDCD